MEYFVGLIDWCRGGGECRDVEGECAWIGRDVTDIERIVDVEAGEGGSLS